MKVAVVEIKVSHVQWQQTGNIFTLMLGDIKKSKLLESNFGLCVWENIIQ